MERKFLRTEESFVGGSKTLRRECFVSPEIFNAEQEKIFFNSWHLIGRADKIKNPGDFMVSDTLGESVITLRNKNGNINSFFNVCRHKGTQLCEVPSGKFSNSIQCPYHAWTYNLDGELIGAPSMKDVKEFDKSLYPLKSVGVKEWQGFVFINLGQSPEPFEKVFAPLNGKLEGWNLTNLKAARTIKYDVKANWKLMFENYNECYHCAPVHPQLVKLSPPTSGENDLTEGNILGGFMIINDAMSLTMSGKTCAIPVGNLRQEDHQRVYYYSIFPNMFLSLHPDYVMVHKIVPLSTDRSIIECSWLFNPEAFEKPNFNPDDGVKFWDITNRQDWHICELSQKGISSRSYESGPYSPRESVPAAFDRYYLRVMSN